jgi:hypothetical protein
VADIEYNFEDQINREMLVGEFLSITLSQWKAWVDKTGDEEIPEKLHEHVVAILLGLPEVGGNTYQNYLQALCLLSDTSLAYLVQEVKKANDA